MKRGRGRCTRCGHSCEATLDSGEVTVNSLISGKDRTFRAFAPEWLSDCCTAPTEMREEER